MLFHNINKPHIKPKFDAETILLNASANVAVSRYGRCQTMVMGTVGSGKTYKTIHDGLVRSKEGDKVLFITDEGYSANYKVWGMANYLGMNDVKPRIHYITDYSNIIGCDYLSKLIECIIESEYNYVVFDVALMSGGDWGKYNRLLLRLNEHNCNFVVTVHTNKKPVLLNRR